MYSLKTGTAAWYVGKLRVNPEFSSQEKLFLAFSFYGILWDDCGYHFTIYVSHQAVMLHCLTYAVMYVSYITMKWRKKRPRNKASLFLSAHSGLGSYRDGHLIKQVFICENKRKKSKTQHMMYSKYLETWVLLFRYENLL